MRNIIVLVLATSALVVAQEDNKAPRFSIGLGVLAPSYSQKFAGNGRLDFDQDKNGFSYTLNNVPHTDSGSSDSYQSQSKPTQYQSTSAQTSASGSDYAQPSPHFSIYSSSRQSSPKQSETAASYHSPSQADYNDHDSQAPGGQSAPIQYQSAGNGGYSGSADGEDDGSYRPDTNTYGDDGSYKPGAYESAGDYGQADGHQGSAAGAGGHQGSGQPAFAAFNFEQNIAHQFQDQPAFQSQHNNNEGQYEPNQGQSYDSEQSQPQPYQAQSTQYKPLTLQTQPSRQHRQQQQIHNIHRSTQQQHQYNPHKTNKQVHRV